MTLDQFANVLKVLRTEVGKDDLPIIWVEFLLKVSAAGARGVTTVDVCKDIDMGQAVASRMVKYMSSFLNTKTGNYEGYGVYTEFKDDSYRHRQRLALSTKGMRIAAKIEEMLK